MKYKIEAAVPFTTKFLDLETENFVEAQIAAYTEAANDDWNLIRHFAIYTKWQTPKPCAEGLEIRGECMIGTFAYRFRVVEIEPKRGNQISEYLDRLIAIHRKGRPDFELSYEDAQDRVMNAIAETIGTDKDLLIDVTSELESVPPEILKAELEGDACDLAVQIMYDYYALVVFGSYSK